MNHLVEMCCAPCIAKLQAIEARAAEDSDTDARQVYEDRRELLGMMEPLLMRVSLQRETIRTLTELYASMARE